MATKRELCEEEEAGWAEFLAVVRSLAPRQLEEPGYFPEGWSVRDLLAHVGSWQAEAGHILQQIRNGTHRPGPLDVERMNRRFYEANKDLPLDVVWAELWSSRNRMLFEINHLPALTKEAEEWFRDSGAAHYGEHLPRLKEWVEELRSR